MLTRSPTRRFPSPSLRGSLLSSSLDPLRVVLSRSNCRRCNLLAVEEGGGAAYGRCRYADGGLWFLVQQRLFGGDHCAHLDLPSRHRGCLRLSNQVEPARGVRWARQLPLVRQPLHGRPLHHSLGLRGKTCPKYMARLSNSSFPPATLHGSTTASHEYSRVYLKDVERRWIKAGQSRGRK